jgi:hypothetical protein
MGDAGLRLGVAICAVGAAVALFLQVVRTRSFGTRPPVAEASGSALRGILYAFGPGMAPTAKESTRTHPVVYALGVGYHLGIFTAFGVLAWSMRAAAAGALPPSPERQVALLLTLLGTIGGVGLLVRRARGPLLRAISIPDDYLANLLTTAFIALAGLRLLAGSLERALLVGAMMLLLYIPLGKIRHCLFFFPARWNLGRHYGRRGTFPLRH